MGHVYNDKLLICSLFSYITFIFSLSKPKSIGQYKQNRCVKSSDAYFGDLCIECGGHKNQIPRSERFFRSTTVVIIYTKLLGTVQPAVR